MSAAEFDHLYHDKVEPILAAREAKRQSEVATYWRQVTFGAAITAVFVVLALATANFPAALIFAVLGYFGVTTFAGWSMSFLYSDVKEQTLVAIATAIDCKYSLDDFDTPELTDMQTFGLLPNFDSASCEDCFTGERRNCEFYVYEAKLEKRSGKQMETVFDGQILLLVFPKKFLGTTIVRRDKGAFNFVDRLGNKLQRVGLEDPKFERDFEVYGTDQVEARDLLHPAFMERLLALETSFNGSNLRCAFDGGDLLLAVEGPNRFELGSMFEPLAESGRVRTVLNDLAEIWRLMDTLLTAERAPLIAMGDRELPTDS